MLRFDAYTATTEAAKHDDLAQLLVDVASGGTLTGLTRLKVTQGRGFHRFAERLALADGGHEFGSVQWGGAHGERVMLEVKGEHTPKVVEALRSRFPHRCTRVDSCADFDAPRAFERLYRACRSVKRAHRLIGGKAGDWDDYPEKGRTLYLGSAASVTRMRLYEKGKQSEYVHLARPNWARMEVQVRPAKEAKATFAALDAQDVWGASRWTRDLAAMCLKEHVDPHPAGTVYRRTSMEEKLDWLCRQAGPMLLELAEDLGSWECVGLTLRDGIAERQRKRGVSGS